jgi:hypothetical protein
MSSLSAMVEEFAGKKEDERYVAVQASFAWGSPEGDKLNRALQKMNGDEQRSFLEQFLRLWFNTSELPRAANRSQLEALLGSNNGYRIGRRLMYTLSGNERQLRCWYGVPGFADPEHIDSCGEGLLFTVSGGPMNVAALAKVLTKNHTQSFRGKHGVTYWLY